MTTVSKNRKSLVIAVLAAVIVLSSLFVCGTLHAHAAQPSVTMKGWMYLDEAESIRQPVVDGYEEGEYALTWYRWQNGNGTSYIDGSPVHYGELDPAEAREWRPGEYRVVAQSAGQDPIYADFTVERRLLHVDHEFYTAFESSTVRYDETLKETVRENIVRSEGKKYAANSRERVWEPSLYHDDSLVPYFYVSDATKKVYGDEMEKYGYDFNFHYTKWGMKVEENVRYDAIGDHVVTFYSLDPYFTFEPFTFTDTYVKSNKNPFYLKEDTSSFTGRPLEVRVRCDELGYASAAGDDIYVYYSTDYDPEKKTGTWSARQPELILTGKYEIWYKIVDCYDRFAEKIDKAVITITKRELWEDDIKWNYLTIHQKDLYFDGKVKNVIPFLFDDDVPLEVSYEGGKVPRDAGEYKASVVIPEKWKECLSFKEGENFTITFAILPAELTITARSNTIVYGDDYSDKGYYLSKVEGMTDEEVRAELAKNGTFTLSAPTYEKGADAGKYAISPDYLLKRNAPVNFEIRMLQGVLDVLPYEIKIDWQEPGDPIAYDGKVRPITASFVDIDGNTVALDVQTQAPFRDAGTYTAYAALPEGYEVNYKLPIKYSNGGYTILKAIVNEPNPTQKFVYNGTEQHIDIPECDLYTILYPTRTDVGSQKVIVQLNDPDNFEWANAKGEKIFFDFVIDKVTVQIPEIGVYVFDNKPHAFTVAENEYYDFFCDDEETVYTDAGDYPFTLVLKDKEHTRWDNGSANDLKLAFRILKADYDMSGVSFPSVTVVVGTTYEAKLIGEMPEGCDGSKPTFEIVGADKTEAGVYTMTAKFTSGSKNYNDPADLTAQLMIKWAEKSVPSETDNEKKLIIVKSADGIDPNLTLIARLVEESEDTDAILKKSVDFRRLDRVFTVYEVSLMDENVYVQPDGVLTIYFTIPEELVGSDFRIIHIHGGEGREIAYKLEDGYAVVETDALSEFVFVHKQTSLLWLIILLSVMLAAAIGCGVWLVIRAVKSGAFKKSGTTLAAAAPIFFLPGHTTAVIILASVFGAILIADLVFFFLLRKKKVAVLPVAEKQAPLDEAKPAKAEKAKAAKATTAAAAAEAAAEAPVEEKKDPDAEWTAEALAFIEAGGLAEETDDESGEDVIGVFFKKRSHRIYYFKYENVAYEQGEIAQYEGPDGKMLKVVVVLPKVRRESEKLHLPLKSLCKADR